MARKPRSVAPAMEPRGSITDPRVRFVPTPEARQLLVIEDGAAFRFPEPGFRGAFVWVRDAEGFASEPFRKDALFACAAAVRVLPREAEDAPLPALAGSPAAVSGPSEVRPVVVELLAELPEALREDASAFVERHLASSGL